MSGVDTVIKLGGGLLAAAGHFESALDVIGALGQKHRVLIVPGGGPFADVVRDVDRQYRLSDDAAHWMAMLGMDQYAELIASRLPGAVLVTGLDEIAAASAAPGRVPVLAPTRLLRERDPLPHSWDVTSDSIAAWITGVIGARRLVLVKPPGVSSEPAGRPEGRPLRTEGPLPDDRRGRALRPAHGPREERGELDSPWSQFVDAYFHRALSPHVDVLIVPADRIDELRNALEFVL
jgi:aspartokinase-like uncharacterized kinase